MEAISTSDSKATSSSLLGALRQSIASWNVKKYRQNTREFACLTTGVRVSTCPFDATTANDVIRGDYIGTLRRGRLSLDVNANFEQDRLYYRQPLRHRSSILDLGKHEQVATTNKSLQPKVWCCLGQLQVQTTCTGLRPIISHFNRGDHVVLRIPQKSVQYTEMTTDTAMDVLLQPLLHHRKRSGLQREWTFVMYGGVVAEHLVDGSYTIQMYYTGHMIRNVPRHYLRKLHPYYIRGLEKKRQGFRRAALVSMVQSIKVEPFFLQAYTEALGLLLSVNKYDDAYPLALRAVIFNPSDPIPHVFLGRILMRYKRFVEAVFSFRTALRLDPLDKEVLTLLTEAEMKARNYYASLRSLSANTIQLYCNDPMLALLIVKAHKAERPQLSNFSSPRSIRSEMSKSFVLNAPTTISSSPRPTRTRRYNPNNIFYTQFRAWLLGIARKAMLETMITFSLDGIKCGQCNRLYTSKHSASIIPYPNRNFGSDGRIQQDKLYKREQLSSISTRSNKNIYRRNPSGNYMLPRIHSARSIDSFVKTDSSNQYLSVSNLAISHTEEQLVVRNYLPVQNYSWSARMKALLGNRVVLFCNSDMLLARSNHNLADDSIKYLLPEQPSTDEVRMYSNWSLLASHGLSETRFDASLIRGSLLTNATDTVDNSNPNRLSAFHANAARVQLDDIRETDIPFSTNLTEEQYEEEMNKAGSREAGEGGKKRKAANEATYAQYTTLRRISKGPLPPLALIPLGRSAVRRRSALGISTGQISNIFLPPPESAFHLDATDRNRPISSSMNTAGSTSKTDNFQKETESEILSSSNLRRGRIGRRNQKRNKQQKKPNISADIDENATYVESQHSDNIPTSTQSAKPEVVSDLGESEHSENGLSDSSGSLQELFAGDMFQLDDENTNLDHNLEHTSIESIKPELSLPQTTISLSNVETKVEDESIILQEDFKSDNIISHAETVTESSTFAKTNDMIDSLQTKSKLKNNSKTKPHKPDQTRPMKRSIRARRLVTSRSNSHDIPTTPLRDTPTGFSTEGNNDKTLQAEESQIHQGMANALVIECQRKVQQAQEVQRPAARFQEAVKTFKSLHVGTKSAESTSVYNEVYNGKETNSYYTENKDYHEDPMYELSKGVQHAILARGAQPFPARLNLCVIGSPMRMMLLEYLENGQYFRQVCLVLKVARRYLRSKKVRKNDIIVFDIDDTALTSIAYLTQTQLQRVPMAAPDWLHLPNAPPLLPVLNFYHFIQKLGYSVVFVSERPDHALNHTKEALVRAGYRSFRHLVLRKPEEPSKHSLRSGEFKYEARMMLTKKGYNIVATVGDQQSDFVGGLTGIEVKLPNYLYIED